MTSPERAKINPGAARRWDVAPVALGAGFTLVHLTHYSTAYWQAVLAIAEYLDVPPNRCGGGGWGP